MRTVLKHVADEETALLPTAERLIPERLTALGVETRRRGEFLRGQTLRMAPNHPLRLLRSRSPSGIGIGLILLVFSRTETRRIGSHS
jgi:hypothetical protein